MVRCVPAFGSLLAIAATPGPAAALTPSGAVDTPGDARHVAVAGTLAYVADDTAGLRVVDLSDPEAPLELGSLAPPALGRTQGVAVDGSRLVLAEGAAGIRVVDAAIPATPTPVGGLAVPGFAYRVRVVGTRAYVAAGNGGLRIVDLANPAQPVALGFAPVGDARDVDVEGALAWVALAVGSAAVDVTDPAAPVVLAALEHGANGVALRDGFAYAGSVVYDARDPAEPVPLYRDFLFRHDVALLGGFGLTADPGPPSALRLFDLSETRERGPLAVASLVLPSACSAMDVEIGAGRAYVATSACGLHVADVSDPAAPEWLGSLAGANGSKASLRLAGGEPLLAAVGFVGGAWALSLVDVANPAAPALLAQVATPSDGDVLLEGDFAYVTGGSAGLRVYDVSDPAAPVLVDTVPLAVSRLRRSELGLYAAPLSGDLRLLDLADPAHPVVLGTAKGGTGRRGIAADAHLAIHATTTGLRTYSFFDPADPVALGAVAVPEGEPQDVDLRGGRALLVGLDAGWVVDVRDPAAPRVVSKLPPFSNEGAAVRIVGEHAYRARGSDARTLDIFDVSAWGALGFQLLEELALPGAAKAVAVDSARSLAVVAAGSAGLAIVDFAAERAAHPCLNGVDDDGDDAVDAFEDAGCRDGDDPDELADCANGLDDDGDGAIDYPADAGCRSALPSAKEDPQCADGVDDDGDGALDYPADPECRSATDDDELRNPAPPCGLGGPEILAPFALLALRRRRRACS